MTQTTFENKITMGNILTALAMLAAIVAGYANLQIRQDELERKSAEISERIQANDGRIRVLEQSAATSTARYESLSQALGEVKAEQRQTNELLRQLLQAQGVHK